MEPSIFDIWTQHSEAKNKYSKRIIVCARLSTEGRKRQAQNLTLCLQIEQSIVKHSSRHHVRMVRLASTISPAVRLPPSPDRSLATSLPESFSVPSDNFPASAA